MCEVKIQWHPGFVAAMDLELSANRNDLIYEREYNLNVKPLEIDLLVIKKNRDIILKNEIGKLFRGHNIMEYKSPQDHMDIDTFYKAQAYASLYKSYGETVDSRKADDITVSLVRETKPLELFRYFEQHRIPVTNPYPGIYYLTDNVLFSTQIIVARELVGQNHAWLKALSNRMDQQDMKNLLEQMYHLNEKYDQRLADAVFTVSANANQQIIYELKGDKNMRAVLEVFKPEIDKIIEERVDAAVAEKVGAAVEAANKASRQKEIRTAANMYQLGINVEKIAQAMGYSPDTVREWVGLSADVPY